MMDTQVDFTAALLDPNVPAPANLVGPNGGAPGARFDVYRNNVSSSLIDAMTTGFPVIAKLIGEANFKTLALMYVRAHPPTSPMLMFYGEAFPAFIEAFEPLKSLPYMSDVARLELALRDSYHAADSDMFNGETLQRLGEEALMAGHLIMAPATRIVASQYPIYDIWLRNSGVDDHAISQDPQHVLVTRPAYDVDCHPLTPAMAAFLAAVQTTPVGTVIETTLSDDLAFPLTEILTLILQTGFAARLELD
ncbi:MAG: putative DNA-binding domain-containing protein [Planktomarina sp.]